MKQTLYKHKKYIIPLIELTSPFKLSSNKLDIFSIVIIISEVFLGKGVLKICSKFTGEHPRRSAISIKLLCNFIEITLRHGCSPVNLLHIFRTPFLKNTSGWLLLYISIISGTMKEHNDKICKEQVVEGGWRNLVLDWNGNWVAGAGRRQPYINPCQICCKPLNDKKCEAHDLQGLFENIFYMNFDFIFLLKA